MPPLCVVRRAFSRREIIRTRFSDANFGFCRVKILGNASAFPAFFSCTRQNLLPENSFDLKLMNFCADFGASDEIRLTPIEDDKSKDAENSKFKASSDYLATAKVTLITLNFSTQFSNVISLSASVISSIFL